MGTFTRFISFLTDGRNKATDQQGEMDLYYKQALKTLEEKIRHKETEFKKMVDLRKLEQEELNKYALSCEKIVQNQALAIDKNDTDPIINRHNVLLNHMDYIGHRIDILDSDIVQLLDSVENLRLQYEQFTIKAKEYFYKPQNVKPKNTSPGIIHQKAHEVL